MVYQGTKVQISERKIKFIWLFPGKRSSMTKSRYEKPQNRKGKTGIVTNKRKRLWFSLVILCDFVWFCDFVMDFYRSWRLRFPGRNVWFFLQIPAQKRKRSSLLRAKFCDEMGNFWTFRVFRLANPLSSKFLSPAKLRKLSLTCKSRGEILHCNVWCTTKTSNLQKRCEKNDKLTTINHSASFFTYIFDSEFRIQFFYEQ